MIGRPVEELAATFVTLLRLAMGRDEAAVLAWSLLGNHYHLVVRQGPVPLSRPMKTLQQGVARARNLRCQVFGPLWQGRFKAKEVVDELGRSTARWRTRYAAREWLELACAHLECDPELLCGRGRAPEVVRTRELIGLVGIERCGVKVGSWLPSSGNREVGSVIGIGGGRPGVRRTLTSRLLPRPLIKPPARSLESGNEPKRFLARLRLRTVETRDPNLMFLRHDHPSGTMSMPRAVEPL